MLTTLTKSVLYDIIQYIDISGYVALLTSCKFIYYTIRLKRNSKLYKIIINNSIRIDSIEECINDIKTIRTKSYIIYGSKKILHGTQTINNECGDNIATIKYNKNKLIKSIVRDTNQRYTSIYVNTPSGFMYIKIKYKDSCVYMSCRGYVWDITGDLYGCLLPPIYYTYKTPYALHSTMYMERSYNIHYTDVYSKFGPTTIIDTADHIHKAMYMHGRFARQICDIVNANTTLLKRGNIDNMHINVVSSNINTYDKFGNIKCVENIYGKTGYKNNNIVKQVINMDDDIICRVNTKYNIIEMYRYKYLLYKQCQHNGYLYEFKNNRDCMATIIKIDNIEYKHYKRYVSWFYTDVYIKIINGCETVINKSEYDTIIDKLMNL